MTDLAPRDDVDHVGPDHWAERVAGPTMSWLHTMSSLNTRTAYATRLGVPRDRQTWRGPHQPRERRPPNSALFTWCRAHGIDPLTEMDLNRLRAWTAAVRAEGGGRSASTVQGYIGTMSSWYREMRKRGLTTLTPGAVLDTDERRRLGVSNVKPAAPTHALTFEQAQALRLSVRLDPLPTRRRNVAIVEVLLSTGVRAAELCGITRGDIERRGQDAALLTVHGKGGKTRTLRMEPQVLATVDAYLLERDQAAAGAEVSVAGHVSGRSLSRQPLFLTSRTRQALTGPTITQMLARLCNLAGERGTTAAARRAAAALEPICGTIHPHQMRRFYAVHSHQMGVPVRRIQADLGHESLVTTQKYLEDAVNTGSTGAAAVVASLTAGNDEWGIE